MASKKKKQCKKGFACGRTCINKSRTCRSNLGKNGEKLVENYAMFVARVVADRMTKGLEDLAKQKGLQTTESGRASMDQIEKDIQTLKKGKEVKADTKKKYDESVEAKANIEVEREKATKNEILSDTTENTPRLKRRQTRDFTIEESASPSNAGRAVRFNVQNIDTGSLTPEQSSKADEIAEILRNNPKVEYPSTVLQTGTRDFKPVGAPTVLEALKRAGREAVISVSVPNLPEVEEAINAVNNNRSVPTRSIADDSREVGVGKVGTNQELRTGVNNIKLPTTPTEEQMEKARQLASTLKRSGGNWNYVPMVQTQARSYDLIGDPVVHLANQMAGQDVVYGFKVPNDPEVIRAIEQIQSILARPQSSAGGVRTVPSGMTPASQ